MAQKKTPAPIDRPLSRAYLRQFRGWSTAYPPGMSEPNSVRLMENVMVDRNGGMLVRPGLHCLTYEQVPDLDPQTRITNAGVGLGLPVIGGPEAFYTNDGKRALLIAVKNGDAVGFRAIRLDGLNRTVHNLTDPEIGFYIPAGESTLSFTGSTRHVEFLQIDNKIIALSDAGEEARLFYAGPTKIARRPTQLSYPRWASTADKLTIVHPDESYITGSPTETRRNLIINPAFDLGIIGWTVNAGGQWRLNDADVFAERLSLELRSRPGRTNMQPWPLHDAAAHGWSGWTTGDGDPVLTTNGQWHVITPGGDQTAWADGSRVVEDVTEEAPYRLALDIDPASTGAATVRATAYAANGSIAGTRAMPLSEFTHDGSGRWESPLIRSPEGSTTLRISLGAEGGWVGFKDICLCPDLQPTSMFTGDWLGDPDYHWTGDPHSSASVYHPPAPVFLWSDPQLFDHSNMVAGSIGIRAVGADTDWQLDIEGTDWNGFSKETIVSATGTATVAGGWDTATVGGGPVLNDRLERAGLRLQVGPLARDQHVLVDAALLEQNFTTTSGVWFYANRNPVDVPTANEVVLQWEGEPQLSASRMDQWASIIEPTPETPTASTLIASGGSDNNPYHLAAFYTFENEFGEGPPSQITEIRMSRSWDSWRLETPNSNGEPSGTDTQDPLAAADQLVASIPSNTLFRARGEGARKAHLYVFTWPDQGPVPTTAERVATIDLYPDTVGGVWPVSDIIARHFRITAQRIAFTTSVPLPQEDLLENNSIPPRAATGFAAADRIILVGDPDQAATINWTSGQPGDYLNFSTSIGGGRKTLSTGNLNIPLAVELWQNPQSVDTLTILCSDDNGESRSYYMQPAVAQSGSGGGTTITSFEETTNTPGTIAPYGAEVLNNALYRPISTELVKSTASNYNINHRSMTDDIENMWFLLQNKRWIVSHQLNNRLYYLVHNPQGETLRTDCVGNEVWVFDVAGKEGVWSRLLIQGNTLAPVKVGSRVYMGVGTDTGFFYLDPLLRHDDIDNGTTVERAPIPWMFETNTQGANRAHDAWAHLQQVGITLGDFTGTAEYGIRGHTTNGRLLDFTKRVTDDGARPPLGQAWDIEDFLQIRRDMKEWYFYARSVDGEYSGGQVSLVQYRYTPISVNVGYEYGSVETFEYGAPDTDYARNGIPLPYMDYNRP